MEKKDDKNQPPKKSIYFNTIFNTFKKFKKKKLEISILLTNSKEMKEIQSIQAA